MTQNLFFGQRCDLADIPGVCHLPTRCIPGSRDLEPTRIIWRFPARHTHSANGAEIIKVPVLKNISIRSIRSEDFFP